MKLLALFATFVAVTQAAEPGDLDWWKHAVFYQIYPRSFKDSNNDGIGDIPGVIQKLDHFSESGINAVWLSPIFKSPQVDQGYDISNYTDIEPDYGTIQDLEELIEKAHSKGIKIILDFVPNHTSDQHQWFIDSVNGVEEYRDYYIWANAKVDDNGERQPPNNWISVMKNSAWTWSEERQQYYFHQFTPFQPDLNYRNPVVVEAMKDVLTFWLDRGVDGFRIDAVPHLFEVEDLKDEPLSDGSSNYNNTDYEYLDHIYTKDQPETFDMIYEWRELVDAYTQINGGDQRVLMTEAYTDIDKTMLYFGTSDGSVLGAHFTFNFNLITDINIDSTAQDIVNSIDRWLETIPKIYTSNWVLGNHDNHRVATRFGPDNVDGFNMLMAILPGVGVTYNGEEIGQENGEVTYEEGQDPSARDPNIFEQVSRDFERTPFQWDDSINAGFNEGAKPWLPVSEKYVDTNLEKQREDAGPSHYKVYKSLLELRGSAELTQGDVQLNAVDDRVILVQRTSGDNAATLIFNVGDEEVTVDVGQFVPPDNKVAIASINSEHSGSIDPKKLTLKPHESLILTSA